MSTQQPYRYLCIDLKSFYASVECVDRGLNPLTTNLYLAKVALDIEAKHNPDFFGELDEDTYKEREVEAEALDDRGGNDLEAPDLDAGARADEVGLEDYLTAEDLAEGGQA